VSAARWKPQIGLNSMIRIGAGILVVLAFFVHEAEWFQYRFVQQMELLAYDTRLRLFMPRTLDPRVVILDIDEKSLNAEGRWPWSRNKLAAMVRELFEHYKVRVVGFDVAFAEPDPSSGLASLEALAKGERKDDPEFLAWLEKARLTLDYDRIFAEEIGKHPVVLGFFLGGKTDKSGVLPAPTFSDESISKPGWQIRHHISTGYSGNIEALQRQATASGHLYPALDVDGVTRRVPMFMKYDQGYYEALSFAITRTYLGNAPVKLTVLPPTAGSIIADVPRVKIGPITIPLDDTMAALVPYRGASGVYRYVSATDVIRRTLPEDELRDKIIIVGTSAQGLLDLRATPVKEDFPGVEVHANLISGFLDQSIMHKPAEILFISVLSILVLGLPFAILLPRLSPITATAAMAVTLALLVAINLYVWHAHTLVLNLAAPLTMLVILYLLNMAWGFFMETRSRRLMSSLFGTYVPKELVDQMSKNPEEYSMRGESREMTVLFSDVRDFTSISEGLSAQSLTDMMNAYLTEMTEVIQHTRGTIDKYIGDAIMAFWGAPLVDSEHAAHGVEAALTMQKKIRSLDPDFARKGWPPLNIGVGLNCGTMNVGDMGSRFRRAYTVMGDAVNLGSRLEGLTKEYGVGILVSDNIVKAAPGFVYREVDKVAVKGRTEGVLIYEPLGRVGEVDESLVEEAYLFEKVLGHYRAQRWDDADRLLADLASASPQTKLYKIFRERIFQYRYNPPDAGWNGVWVFKTK
jgi:adenylate cyclase